MCVCVCVCVCARAQLLSGVWLFCNPMDCSPPGSSVHGIFQARTLEWAVISFSRGSFQPGTELVPPVSPALEVDSLPLRENEVMYILPQ